MNRQEALNIASSQVDARELRRVYDEWKADNQVAHAVISNKFCPDEIKKDYVVFVINDKLPSYERLQTGSHFADMLDSLKRSVESWQPIQRVSQYPAWDDQDADAKAIADILVNRKRELILYGAPGTSKTRLAKMVAAQLTERDESRVKFVQFHASYSYEDFIEGIVPREIGGSVSFRLEAKVFKEFCEAASRASGKRFVMIIDEINRADLSKVLGELFTCLEYRGETVRLLYSREQFQIPQNVYLLGTMNTLDRSTYDIDYALRRRFYFYEVPASESRLRQILAEKKVPQDIQDKIAAAFNFSRQQGYELGHAYFKDVEDVAGVQAAWEHQIRPLMEQFFVGERGKVADIQRSFERIWTANPGQP